MNMKNLNPASGLKQIARGSIFVHRYPILKSIRGKTLKPVELGYYLILVSSADWDVDRYRKGLIRYELPLLAKIWNIPYPTLVAQLNNLVQKGLIVYKTINNQRVPSIVNFEHFTHRAQRASTELNLPDDELERFFLDLLSDYQIQEPNQTKGGNRFNVSSNGYLSDEDIDFIDRSIDDGKQKV
jgi:hypothetical protein